MLVASSLNQYFKTNLFYQYIFFWYNIFFWCNFLKYQYSTLIHSALLWVNTFLVVKRLSLAKLYHIDNCYFFWTKLCFFWTIDYLITLSILSSRFMFHKCIFTSRYQLLHCEVSTQFSQISSFFLCCWRIVSKNAMKSFRSSFFLDHKLWYKFH